MPLRPSHLLSGIFPANPPVETVNIVVKVESPGEWGNGSPVYLIGPISLYLSLRFARLWLFSNDICTSPRQAIASRRRLCDKLQTSSNSTVSSQQTAL